MNIIFLLTIIFKCISFEQISYNAIINFTNEEIQLSGKGVDIFGGNVNITMPGSYLIKGNCSEGGIKIYADYVNLYLENLELTSSISSPIWIDKNLKDIKIIGKENVVLNDFEEFDITGGDCAVIKIKKGSKVSFKNQNNFILRGDCKNGIKGAANVSIIFEPSEGEYTINAYQNGIVSEGLLTFNGGKFNISTIVGDGIQAKPDENDTISLGKILVNNGIFNIQSHSDAFQAKNIIEIKKGNFNIMTENGYNSTYFDKNTGSSKGFKTCNNEKGYGIKVYDGNFLLNTSDDAFHSDGYLTLINGNYTVYAGEDAFHAGAHLLIGEKDSEKSPNINIFNCYEAIEGNSIRIYSGKINAVSFDDGINAAKKNKSKNQYKPQEINNYISIYGGDINLLSNKYGLNSKGNIFIHGGNLNILQGDQNSNIKHFGNFTLFNSSILCIGLQNIRQIHEDILKGNQLCAFYNESIGENKLLKIKNQFDKIIKEEAIRQKTNYIFYSSSDLNEKYKFYISDVNGDNEEELIFTIQKLKSGPDDQDIYPDYDEGKDSKDNQKKKKGNKVLKIILIIFLCFLGLIALLAICYCVCLCRRESGSDDIFGSLLPS